MEGESADERRKRLKAISAGSRDGGEGATQGGCSSGFWCEHTTHVVFAEREKQGPSVVLPNPFATEHDDTNTDTNYQQQQQQ